MALHPGALRTGRAGVADARLRDTPTAAERVAGEWLRNDEVSGSGRLTRVKPIDQRPIGVKVIRRAHRKS
jgi:hypothetical protein